MRIHHIGYAVKNIQISITKLESFGYKEISKAHDTVRNLDIVFMQNAGYCIELVCPFAEGSPVNDFLKKNGEGVYHICYEVPNIEAEVTRLKKEKFVQVSKKQTAIAINNKNVIFMYSSGIGLIELVEA